MAIDTAARRFSTMHVPFGGWVFPGGAFDADDRRDVLGAYRGIATGSTAPPVEFGGGAGRFFILEELLGMRFQFVGLLRQAVEVRA